MSARRDVRDVSVLSLEDLIEIACEYLDEGRRVHAKFYAACALARLRPYTEDDRRMGAQRTLDEVALLLHEREKHYDKKGAKS